MTRREMIGQAMYAACDPHVRLAVERNEHPDRYVIKRTAERALAAMRTRGDLPESMDITATVTITRQHGRFRLHVGYSDALYAWIAEGDAS